MSGWYIVFLVLGVASLWLSLSKLLSTESVQSRSRLLQGLRLSSPSAVVEVTASTLFLLDPGLLLLLLKNI